MLIRPVKRAKGDFLATSMTVYHRKFPGGYSPTYSGEAHRRPPRCRFLVRLLGKTTKFGARK